MVPVVSIVVCMGRSEETRECLESLLREDVPGHRIVVVENGTTENTEKLSPRFPDVLFLPQKRNLGFAAGNNAGIAHAKHLWHPQYYFLVNNDARLQPGALCRLLSHLEANPAAGMAAPKILSDAREGTLWAAGGEFFSWRFLGRNRGQGEKDLGQYDSPRPQPFLSACALLVRRGLFDSTGLFDERFFIYAEDLDLCLRAARRDWRLDYLPQAVVVHKGSATAGGQYGAFQSFYRWRNRFLNVWKHGGPLQKIFFFTLFAPALMLRDCRAYLKLGHAKSIPFLWRGWAQFLDIALVGENFTPLAHPAQAGRSGETRPRLRAGYLLRNRLFILLLGLIDFIGRRIRKGNGDFIPPANPKKILLAKIDHLGDVLLSLGLLPALKSAHPRTEIHFVCGSWALPLLEGHPLIDRIFTFDHLLLNRRGNLLQKVLRHLSDSLKMIRLLRRENYDLALDLRAYFPNFIPWLALGGVRNRVGFSTGGGGFLLHAPALWRENSHETDHFSEILAALHLPPVSEPPSLDYLASRGSSSALLGETGGGSRRKICLLQTASPHRVKLWQPEKWRDLIAALEKRGLRVICTGGAEERRGVEAIIRGSAAENFCGRTSLPELAALLKKAEWALGVDSLLPHLAAVLGVKSAALFNGIEKTSQWKPIGKRAAVVTKAVPCSPCYLKNGCSDMICLESGVQDFLAAMRTIDPDF